tara:strand:+ start:671 stop:4336 length:3666 start_codon:yes stop_codon:yes gene_type:complete
MKKITLMLFVLVAFCWQSNAQIFIQESLDSGFPAGWTQVSYFTSTAEAYLCEGSGNIADNMYSSASNDGSFTSPNYVGGSNGTDTTVEFQWLARPYLTNPVDYIIYVEYSTDDGAAWNSISSFGVTETTACSQYSETIPAASLPSGSDFKFRIRGEWQSGDSYFYLDNIFLTQTISCPQPSLLSATNTTIEGADLSWTENGSSALYNIEIVEQGEAITGNATDTGVANPYTKTGLMSGTSYDFYVQADCGADLSAWAGPFTFTTECEAFTVPYTEDFDTTATGTSSSPTIPTCWSFIDGGTGYGYVSSTGANSFYMYNAADVTNDYILVSPETTDLTSGLNRVSFDVDGSIDQQLIVGTLTDAADGTTFTAIETITLVTNDYESYTVNIPAGTDSYLAFKHGLTGSYDAYFLDNISIETIPSCVEPTDLSAMSITTSTADLAWTDNAGASAWNVELGELGFTPTGTATNSSVANPFEASSLTAATAYEYYVQADCGGGDTSPWVGPFSFYTACETITMFPWTEDLESTSETLSCWSSIDNNEDGDAWIIYDSAAYANSGTQAFGIYTDYNAGANDDYLVSPQLALTGGERLKFQHRVRSVGEPNDFTVLLSTTGTEPTDFTETLLANASYDNIEYQEVIIDLTAYTGDVYIAFHVPATGLGLDGWYLYIDDVIVEEVPACVEPSDLLVTGFSYTSADIAWTAGDSETLWDIEVVDITNGETVTGTATETEVTNPYTINSLTADHDYNVYVRANCGDGVSPWIGPLSLYTGYCSSVPSSNDGDGISNLQVGSVDFASGGDITYEDFTGSPVDLAAGINSNVQITFVTGYTYGTNIWIDFDDDLVFDASDLVYTGESTNADPTTLDASFTMPSGASLGQHRMRIVTDDTNANATDPCNSSTYGVTMDVDVNIVVASCAPAEATATIVSDCANNQFSIDVDVTALGDGIPELYDGTNTYAVSSLGIITVGPYTSGTSIDLNILHGTDNTCDLFVGAFVYDCPPLNDDCLGAFAVTVENEIADFASATQIQGSIAAATDSGVAACAGTSNDDVWYSFVATSADINIDVTDDFDGVIELFSGECGSLVSVECDDYDSTFGNPRISRTDFVVGETYLLRVFYYYATTSSASEFTLAIWSESEEALSVDNFDVNAFTYFPNPVKNTLTLNAQNTIEQVSMYNMLGQEVLRATPNAIDSELDMSQLQTGAYFVKVTIANITQTIRVIKQ